jgi:hypothetical protein
VAVAGLEAATVAVAAEPDVGAAEEIVAGGALDVGTAAAAQADNANAAMRAAARELSILVTYEPTRS